MSNYCPDCGSRTGGGICSNCQEELWILENQSEYIDEVSQEFADKAKEQQKELNKRKLGNYYGT